MSMIDGLINSREGLISNEVFSPEMHRLELDRIFGRCWLFLGHESMIPEPHDYFASYMGDASVVVQRDGKSKVRVYLNKCRHRGAELCLYDAGNTKSFTCAYHGWSYTDGALTAVPYQREAYGAGFDLAKWGLAEAPRVSTLGGLIFASWDSGALSLDDYLGDAKWWLENFMLQEDMGGLEVVPGAQKYMMPVNWKLLAENFAGDNYHFISTHASMVQLLSRSNDSRVTTAPNLTARKMTGDNFSVATNCGTGAPGGFVEVKVGANWFEHDIRQAETLGPEAVEWLTERRRRIEERMTTYKVKPYSFHAGNIFPNFAMIGVSTAFYAKGLLIHHPTAFDRSEVWMWCAVEKSAPSVVKERQKFVLSHRQSAAGMVAPDDHENMQRITANLRASLARRYDFHYAMALGHQFEDPRPPELREGKAWPGRVLPQFSEVAQRDFYRYWAELMKDSKNASDLARA
jgi:phenylpropionate dioxygenase-like ring-hydroxylating dioxygenase large terminal subunit